MWSSKGAKRREWHSSYLQVHPGIQRRGAVFSVLDQLWNLEFNPHEPSHTDPAWAQDLPVFPFITLLPSSIPGDGVVSFLDTTAFAGDLARTIEPPAPNLAAVTDFVRRYQDAAIAWVSAALDAGVVTSAMVQRAVSDFTVGYAFSSSELRAVDGLATSQQRAATDALAQRFLALPGLEAWQERPRVAYVQHCPAEATRQTSSNSLPLIDDYSWWVSSQIPLPVWIAYDPVDPQVFGFEDSAPSDVPIESTCEVFGDDAGDVRIKHPKAALREDLRVFEVSGIDDVVRLVERYPARLVESDCTRLFPEWAGHDAPIEYVLDWVRLAKDYDGVRLSVPAALEVAYVPVRVNTPGGGTAMFTGWTPGSTVYLRDPRTTKR
ncbi:hypothetical protein [Trueperella pyogenes]|uniref:hypothetical protein n=1 Tax=Trueperella pyogenes TaxID=1661 RepID=UPI00345D6845